MVVDYFKNLSKKKEKDSESQKLQRRETSVGIRKQKKEEQLTKKRQLNPNDTASEEEAENWNMEKSFKDIVSGLTSGDVQQQLTAAREARKLVSQQSDPPIDLLIKAGIVPHLVEFLRRGEMPQLQYEAAWALTNIAAGTAEQTRTVVTYGAIPCFISLLSHPEDRIVGQAVWALGNIVGDGAALRDEVLKHIFLPSLLNLINLNYPTSLVRKVSWTLSNLCRYYDPPPRTADLRASISGLNQLIKFSDQEIVFNACCALGYISSDTNEGIQLIIDSGIIHRVLKLVVNPQKIVSSALWCIGNIALGTDEQTDAVIAHGSLPVLAKLLKDVRSLVVTQAAWIISNITAGNKVQIQEVIDAGCLEPLIGVLRGCDFKSQKEAVWAVKNLTIGGTPDQILALWRSGAIKPICDLLSVQDADFILNILCIIENILKSAIKLNRLEEVSVMIEECGGLDKIEELQQHENVHVFNGAAHIIEKHLGGKKL